MVTFTNKRLQVFVSSTYEDLKTERQAAVETILKAGHIPAGMELFTSGDESQTAVINQWIDESDMYLLVLGGRYGSINKKLGKSYIELEYEYAIRKGKPFFAVVIKEAALRKRVKSKGLDIIERDNPKQLEAFRREVCTRMVEFWDDQKDIKLAVAQKLLEISRRSDLKGWVRPVDGVDITPLTEEIARLSRENSELRKRTEPSPMNQALSETRHITRKLISLTNEPSLTPNRLQDAICAWRLSRTVDDLGKVLNNKWSQEARSSSVQVNFLFVSIIDLLQPSDSYDTVTNMRFWQLDAINGTRFLESNIGAVRRGVNIRRVFLVDKEELADSKIRKGYERILHQHYEAEVRANSPGGAGGRLTTRVLYADDFKQLRGKYGHFGVASRPAIGSDPPDTLFVEPIYRGGNANDGGITELDFLFPKPGHPEMDRLKDLTYHFEALFGQAEPVQPVINPKGAA